MVPPLWFGQPYLRCLWVPDWVPSGWRVYQLSYSIVVNHIGQSYESETEPQVNSFCSDLQRNRIGSLGFIKKKKEDSESSPLDEDIAEDVDIDIEETASEGGEDEERET